MEFKEMQKKLYKLKYFNSFKAEIEKEIRRIKQDCQSLREYKAIELDGMPKAMQSSDSVGNNVVKIIDIYEKRISELLAKLEKNENERKLILNLIEQLNPDEKDVIITRYLNGCRWKRIPSKINISRSHCFRVHKSAILNLIKLYKNCK